MFYLTNEALPFFIPLGFIGLYRWFWYCIRILAYCLYKPLKPRRHPRYKPGRDVTIVVPTIDAEDHLLKALKSWLKNDPFEVIFVTIPSMKPSIEQLVREADPTGAKIRVVTISKPNKRNQMVAGANHVRTEITVFCDDDVIWPPTMLEWMLAPFEDRQMGGVGTSQRAIALGKRMTMWEVLAAYRLSMRNVEIVSTTYIDGGVPCLSGRTAAYRTRILRDPEWQWQFTHEFWMKKYYQHSGDDKFLTRWLVSHAWKTHIQACKEAELQSTFKDNWRFIKQLLRWTRNTWRSDMRSLITERFIWRRNPFTAFTLLDKFFNMFTLLAGPITVAYLCVRGGELPIWVIITSYLIWLLITRMVKYMPHFVRRPWDILYLPVWVVFNIFFALLKLYCLFTLHVTDWGTREGADDEKGHKEDVEIYTPHWHDDPVTMQPPQHMMERVPQFQPEFTAPYPLPLPMPYGSSMSSPALASMHSPPALQHGSSAPVLPPMMQNSASTIAIPVYTHQHPMGAPPPRSTSSRMEAQPRQTDASRRPPGPDTREAQAHLHVANPHVSVNLSVMTDFTTDEDENDRTRNNSEKA